jgi:hypothetical protein
MVRSHRGATDATPREQRLRVVRVLALGQVRTGSPGLLALLFLPVAALRLRGRRGLPGQRSLHPPPGRQPRQRNTRRPADAIIGLDQANIHMERLRNDPGKVRSESLRYRPDGWIVLVEMVDESTWWVIWRQPMPDMV